MAHHASSWGTGMDLEGKGRAVPSFLEDIFTPPSTLPGGQLSVPQDHRALMWALTLRNRMPSTLRCKHAGPVPMLSGCSTRLQG